VRQGSKPTIREVAEKAGVSLTTVSYVLSGRHGGTTRISQPTKDRVHAAVHELGYVPNQAARGMRRGRTDLVAVAIGDLESPWDRALATAAARILPKHGYQPVILLGESWRQFMLSGGADGIIVASVPGSGTEDATMLELAKRGVALVAVSESIRPAGFDVVAAGRRGGADTQAAGSVPSDEPVFDRIVAALVDRLEGKAPAEGVRLLAP
jgi:DNA-binding LacI/PurR family transcriptional regulator